MTALAQIDAHRRGASRLAASRLTLGYSAEPIVTDLDIAVPDGELTVIVGANACGKSTLLRGLARLLDPLEGSVVLDGKAIATISTREVARRLGVLPQTPIAPPGVVVADLVGRGRHPHQGWFRAWSQADEAAVMRALEQTGIADLAERPVEDLSGGQRQRVWIAMVLAQDTGLMLLDEPTTYLDLAHQVEVLDLLADLVQKNGRTVVAVLHELNHACRYADTLVAMKTGRIVAMGRPEAIVTEDLVADVFGLNCRIVPDPVSGTPMIVPIGRHGRRDVAHAAE